MTKPIRFDEEAEKELAEAASWYERERAGLGKELLAAIAEAVVRIRRSLGLHTLSAGIPEELGVRRVLVRRFPYTLPFVVLDAEIRVLAVAHGRRRPGYWRDRTRKVRGDE